MFEVLLEKLGIGAIHRINMITNITSQIVKSFEQEFAQDGNAKNIAIDALIELLQKHKQP